MHGKCSRLGFARLPPQCHCRRRRVAKCVCEAWGAFICVIELALWHQCVRASLLSLLVAAECSKSIHLACPKGPAERAARNLLPLLPLLHIDGAHHSGERREGERERGREERGREERKERERGERGRGKMQLWQQHYGAMANRGRQSHINPRTYTRTLIQQERNFRAAKR